MVFLPDGHSDFAALRTKAGGEQASFVAFDLLGLEGDDLRQRPLEERRDALARLVAGVDGVRFSEAIETQGVLPVAANPVVGPLNVIGDSGAGVLYSGSSVELRSQLSLSPENLRVPVHLPSASASRATICRQRVCCALG